MNNKDKIAQCTICLLGERMKSCSMCPFNPNNVKLSPQEKQDQEIIELLKGVQTTCRAG